MPQNGEGGRNASEWRGGKKCLRMTWEERYASEWQTADATLCLPFHPVPSLSSCASILSCRASLSVILSEAKNPHPPSLHVADTQRDGRDGFFGLRPQNDEKGKECLRMARGEEMPQNDERDSVTAAPGKGPAK